MTEEESKIQDYLSRPCRYVNIDGLNELSWGAILCGFSCLDWLHTAGPPGAWWHSHWIQGSGMLAMILSVYLAGKALKRYVTYPRTGYVAYPQTQRTRMVPLIAAVAGAVTAPILAIVLRGGHLRMATLLGVVNFVFYIAAAQPMRPWKYGFLLLIAAGTLWVADDHALAFFGLAFLASGATTLALYLRQTRAAQ